MIINKTTTNSVVVNSLVLTNSSKKPIKNITEFNTATLVATISGGPATETAAAFQFVVSDHDDVQTLVTELPDELHPYIITRHRYKGKKAMDDVDTLPDDHFAVLGGASPCLVECSNCNTVFLMVFAQGKVWGTSKPNATDKSFTLTEMDADNLTCDNCSNNVSVFEPF